MNKKILIGVLSGIVVLALFAVYYSANSSNDLKRVSSYSELVSYLDESNKQSSSLNFNSKNSISLDSFSQDAAGVSASEGSADPQKTISYSSTNVQVSGVDEPDIVKNDGKYIYKISSNKVYIINAYPADSMKIISELSFDNYVTGIFVNDGKLIVLESAYGQGGDIQYPSIELPEGSVKNSSPSVVEESKGIPDPTIMADPQNLGPDQTFVSEKGVSSPGNSGIVPPREGYGPYVNIHIYDITGNFVYDPKLLKDFSVEGSYYSSRIIDNKIYVISNKYVNYADPVIPFFGADGDNKIADVNSVYYPGYLQSNPMFTSVMAIDIESLDFNGDVFITGSGSAIYVSDNAIYIASSKPYDYSKIQSGDDLKVYLDLVDSNSRSKIEDIINSDSDYSVKSDKIRLVIQEYFNRLSSDEKKDFEKSYGVAIGKYYSQLSKEYEKTLIHKINIDGLDISYGGVAEIPGYIFNQFSISEFEGNLRVVTNSGNIFGGYSNSFNNIYVLDSDLNILGKIEDFAQGDQIYSVRFLENYAYMTTSRENSQFYVIDLSDSTKPEVLGYSKIKGFSNYLQPIGDHLVLGIGRASSNSFGPQNLKVSLIDVSDFENPKELSSYVLDADYSSSDAEYEPKSVLLDYENGLLVIPVSYSEQSGNNWKYWQGAFVFKIGSDGISLRGKIAHDLKQDSTNDVGEDRQYFPTQGYVYRSLTIGDSLYTVSDYLIKANNIDNLSEVGSIKLSNNFGYGVIGIA